MFALYTAPIVNLPSASTILASTTEIASPWFDAFWPLIVFAIGMAVVFGVLAFVIGIFKRD